VNPKVKILNNTCCVQVSGGFWGLLLLLAWSLADGH